MGESFSKAKVEIKSLKTGLKPLSFEIIGLKIADKNDVWKNVVDIEQMKFGLNIIPLLSKKIIIDDMTIENIKWDTKRKTSGELPPKKKKLLEKKKKQKESDGLTTKLFDSFKENINREIENLPSVNAFKNIKNKLKTFDATKLIEEADLETYKVIESLRTDSVEKYEKYRTNIENLNIQNQVKEIKRLLEESKNIKIKTIDDIIKAQNTIKDLNNRKKDIEKTIKDIKQLQKDIATTLQDKKSLIKKIDDIAKRDYQNLLSKTVGPFAGDTSNIAEMLFGPIWYGRVNKILEYFALVRKYIPSQKEDEGKKEFPGEQQSIDVQFNKRGVPPKMLIKKIHISGTTGGEGKEVDNPVAFKGVIHNLTSDQRITGRPTHLDAIGQKAGKEYKLIGNFDHIKEIPVDTISIKFNNLSINELSLGKNDVLPELKQGIINVESSFTLNGDEIDCQLNTTIRELVFSLRKGKDEIENIVDEVFSSIKEVTLIATLAGSPNSLKTHLKSNLDSLIGNSLKNIYEKKLAELKKRLRTELSSRIQQEKEKLINEYSLKKEELIQQVKERLSFLEEEKAKLEQKITEKKQKILEKQKKETEKVKDKLKDKLPSNLKNLFK